MKAGRVIQKFIICLVLVPIVRSKRHFKPNNPSFCDFMLKSNILIRLPAYLFILAHFSVHSLQACQLYHAGVWEKFHGWYRYLVPGTRVPAVLTVARRWKHSGACWAGGDHVLLLLQEEIAPKNNLKKKRAPFRPQTSLSGNTGNMHTGTFMIKNFSTNCSFSKMRASAS